MRPGREHRAFSEINVTPFVDVMLVLLIIFMVTAPMLEQGIDVDLPETTTQPLQMREEPLILSVKKDGTYHLARQAIPLEELEPKLKAIFEGADREGDLPAGGQGRSLRHRRQGDGGRASGGRQDRGDRDRARMRDAWPRPCSHRGEERERLFRRAVAISAGAHLAAAAAAPSSRRFPRSHSVALARRVSVNLVASVPSALAAARQPAAAQAAGAASRSRRSRSRCRRLARRRPR